MVNHKNPESKDPKRKGCQRVAGGEGEFASKEAKFRVESALNVSWHQHKGLGKATCFLIHPWWVLFDMSCFSTK